MISVKQAIKIVEQDIVKTKAFKTLNLESAIGYFLFKDIVSPINMPPFHQSAMDGYAISLHNQTNYKVIDEVKAGDNHIPILKKGEAVRIFTGAPVPETANAVLMQEKVEVENKTITITSPISINQNIRPLGEQIKTGETALKKGTKLTPAAIGFLASLGISEIPVYKKPSIAIVVTGNELAQAGETLAYGQIYESNAIMLSTALKNLGYNQIKIHKVNDDYQKTLHLLDDVISKNDVVLISGGISVGDYDFVGKALQELKVEELFYKVKQKPGKPLFFGKKGIKIIFALPGNPAAALSCFYVYVQIALQKFSGNSNFSLTKIKAVSKSNYTKKVDRSQFLKANYRNGNVEILEGQNSSMLHTFALANAFVFVPETTFDIKINDSVEVILLPIN
jgi:molybdopterin molybdotransferase